MAEILVIEDNPSVLSSIVKMLRAENFKVLSASNGEIGLELAQKHIPDLIICDIMMPILDGYGVLSALQTDVNTAAIPFIFLTAKADKADFRQGMESGSDDYLTKPFTRAELLSSVNAQLAKREMVRLNLRQKLNPSTDNSKEPQYTPLSQITTEDHLFEKDSSN